MAIFDSNLILCEGKSFASAVTSDVYDGVQENPDLGSMVPQFYVCIQPVSAAGTGSMTFNLQDSSDNSTFTTRVAATFPIAALKKGMVAFPVPPRHEEYLRLTTAASSTITGTFSAYLNNKFELPVTKVTEGYDTITTVD